MASARLFEHKLPVCPLLLCRKVWVLRFYIPITELFPNKFINFLSLQLKLLQILGSFFATESIRQYPLSAAVNSDSSTLSKSTSSSKFIITNLNAFHLICNSCGLKLLFEKRISLPGDVPIVSGGASVPVIYPSGIDAIARVSTSFFPANHVPDHHAHLNGSLHLLQREKIIRATRKDDIMACYNTWIKYFNPLFRQAIRVEGHSMRSHVSKYPHPVYIGRSAFCALFGNSVETIIQIRRVQNA